MPTVLKPAYLLGLLAMIKCSICSYQCDNWYGSNMSLCLSHYFSRGRVTPSLLGHLQVLPCALHKAGSSPPFGVTYSIKNRIGAYEAVEVNEQKYAIKSDVCAPQ